MVLSRQRRGLFQAMLLLLLLVILYNALFSFSYSVGPNYKNVSVDTTVNITNALPIVLQVTLPASVTLSAGGIEVVQCNVSVMDYNGYDDINITNATLYHSTSSSGAVDNNNTHYSIANCTLASQSGNYRNVTCSFNVTYYAVNGTWTCNATAYDTSRARDSETTTTAIGSLLALNLSTTLIDYGNMAVGDTSANQSVDITNIGNVPINFSVKGYGAYENDGLAFNCAVGNISIENEKYSLDIADDYGAKTALSSSFVTLNTTIEKQTVPGVLETNTTYWQLYVPPNPYGQCNGTIVFQAQSTTV